MVCLQNLKSEQNFGLLINAIYRLCKNSSQEKCRLALRSVLNETMEHYWNRATLSSLEFVNVNCNIVKQTVDLLDEKENIVESEAAKSAPRRQEVTIGQRIFEIQEHDEKEDSEETPMHFLIKNPH